MKFLNIAKDKYLRVIIVLSFFILLVTALIFYLKLGATESLLIIHYEAEKGIDFLGSHNQVYGILLSAFAIIVINFLLADFLYKRERFLSYIFVFTSLALAILILIAISVIISVN